MYTCITVLHNEGFQEISISLKSHLQFGEVEEYVVELDFPEEWRWEFNQRTLLRIGYEYFAEHHNTSTCKSLSAASMSSLSSSLLC